MRLSLLLTVLLLSSCGNFRHKAKDTINKGGEAVGETFTEFFEGVSEGVDKTLQCEVSLADSLLSTGLRMGKVDVHDADHDGSENYLTIYLIYNKTFSSAIRAIAYDKHGNEVGRTTVDVKGEKGNASYVDFIFDKRTDLEAKSKIVLDIPG